MGLGMSLDEAQVLLQSAKNDKSTEDLKLDADEFSQLIFSKDENL